MQRHLEYFDDTAGARPAEGTPPAPDAPSTDAITEPAPRVEREAMAWPPSAWERPAAAWRADAWSGPEPFVPFQAEPLPVLDIPVAAPAAPSSASRLARELVETIVLTVLIFLGIRLVIQNFKIEGSSMEPTLHSGQFLLVNKLAYRGSGEPQRGDIVVFKSWSLDKDFIKRVIGMPGDTVEIRDNAVWINGERLEESYLNQVTTGPDQAVHLGEGQYYVMGDNRGNSSDSRSHGALQGDRIIGKAWFTYWPPGNIGFVPASNASHAADRG